MPDLIAEALAVRIGGIELVSDVSFRLESGGALGVVGETGSGKTLTCRVLTGTLARIGGQAVRGTVRLGETELVGLSDGGWQSLRGRVVALVPQNSLSGLDPVMSVGRQLSETVRELTGAGNAKQGAAELLERVRMPRASEVLRSFPHELSGGMRQRVMIALALAGGPALLVADEPTTALDVTVEREILRLLGDLRRESGMSVVLVSHDLAVVEETTDQVAVMYAGTTVEFASTSTLFANPRHPYTKALLAARPGARRPGERLADIPGYPPSPHDWPTGCRFAPRCAHVQPECEAGAPELRMIAGDHRAACVRLEELADGR